MKSIHALLFLFFNALALEAGPSLEKAKKEFNAHIDGTYYKTGNLKK